MKVILATGELATLTNVARASLAAMMAGADFIKTSTGKEPVNATLPVGLVMTRMIREYADRTGHAVGFKPAGGIRTAKGALDWLILMKEELGDRVARRRPLPAGGERPAHRHRAPARALRHRALQRGPPPSDGLMTTTVARIFETMEWGPAPEASGPALEWLQAHGGSFGLFIDGRWMPPVAGETFETINPATRATLARIAQAGKPDVDAAVAAARAAPSRSGRACPVTRGRATSTRWRARSRSTPGCSRCSRVSTTASRFARRAISTSRWWPGTSITTRAGRSWRRANSPATVRSASSGRSFRGTSRC